MKNKLEMSKEILNLLYYGIQKNCKRLSELENAPERDENEIKAVKEKLKGDGEGLKTYVPNAPKYDLTDEEKEYWEKFLKNVMNQWDTDALCRTCKIFNDFPEPPS